MDGGEVSQTGIKESVSKKSNVLMMEENNSNNGQGSSSGNNIKGESSYNNPVGSSSGNDAEEEKDLTSRMFIALLNSKHSEQKLNQAYIQHDRELQLSYEYIKRGNL